ncbi:uncharacterized protein LOC131957116 [Physella acuta]|uniref:uncharacterized protein LOC131957116 n=1 Tax=Physella acuta TaxID=109671 RepID=UPI0027DBAC96|nr:uncharacterized protein LOC131957116 [Physella acuta]
MAAERCTDDTTYTNGGRQCSSIIQNSLYLCYEQEVKDACCKSCQQVNTTVAGCEFGDHVSNCEMLDCFRSDMQTKCCETCKIPFTYTTSSTSTSRPSTTTQSISTSRPTTTTTAERCTDDITYTNGGRHCSSIAQNSPYLCYEQEVKDACCMSCQQVNTTVAGCEYGDKDPSWCDLPDSCIMFPDKCCDTCSKTGPGIGYETTTCIDDSNFRYNGRSCSSAVETFKGKCYNTDFQQTCCRSCLSARNVSAIGCEYGDRNPSKCFNKNSCKNYKADCCAHCNTSTRLQVSIFLSVMVSALKMFSIL